MTGLLAPVGRFVVPPDHPSLAGHFPGQPMVPGVMVLDGTVALILHSLPGMHLAGIVASKFTAVVLPEQVIEVSCGPLAGDRVDFLCTVAGVPVARGTLRLSPVAGPD